MMNPDLIRFTPADALFWLVIFSLGGAVIALIFVPFVIATRRGVISYMSAFGFGVALAMLGCIPIRVVETEVVYHQSFREGWWPIIWAISYTATLVSVLRPLADKLWENYKDDQHP